MSAEIIKIKKSNGIAGQVAYDVTFRHPEEPAMTVSFVGSVYGSPGPVTLVMPDGQLHVDDPARYGDKLNEQWLANFYRDVN